MSDHHAWSNVLREWAPLFGEGLSVHLYDIQSKRQVGDWWRDKNAWCVHLDARHYASVEGSTLVSDQRIRNIFRYSLRSVVIDDDLTWGRAALEYARQLPQRLAFRQENPENTSGHPLDSLSCPLPFAGRFIWLSFESGDRPLNMDVLHSVEEVIEAYQEQTFIGWISERSSKLTALLYLPSVEDAETATDAREWTMQLLKVLESDIYLAAAAGIGCSVHSNSDVVQGMTTAWIAFRDRHLLPKPLTVGCWGEHPWTVLLGMLSENDVSQFREAVSMKSPTLDVSLTQELQDTLFGIIAANLNVSEASRLLFLHRNTLNHRIERIRQQTGYDVRNFEDALTLWTLSCLSRLG